uniref:Uncharacterized protein n=1 Tax=Arundo donax TaxID=35708 RepID=A0A0A8ZBD4_ARUDO
MMKTLLTLVHDLVLEVDGDERVSFPHILAPNMIGGFVK